MAKGEEAGPGLGGHGGGVPGESEEGKWKGLSNIGHCSCTGMKGKKGLVCAGHLQWFWVVGIESERRGG